MFSYPTPDANQHCQCTNPAQAFWCPTGHMLECHWPMNCATAACGHLIRYDYDPNEVSEMQERMLAAIQAGRVPGYAVAGDAIISVPLEAEEEEEE